MFEKWKLVEDAPQVISGCHETKLGACRYHENFKTFVSNLYCLKKRELVGFPDVNKKQFKFSLLDYSSGLHFSESTVSISYTFRLTESSGELGKGTGKIYS
jgi:hypothetical protein